MPPMMGPPVCLCSWPRSSSSFSCAQSGKAAKASLDVKVGDVIEIGFGTKSVKVEVLGLLDTTKKDEAKELFRYL